MQRVIAVRKSIIVGRQRSFVCRQLCFGRCNWIIVTGQLRIARGKQPIATCNYIFATGRNTIAIDRILFAGDNFIIAGDRRSLSGCNESLSADNYTYVVGFQYTLLLPGSVDWRSDATRGENRQFNERIDVGGRLALTRLILAFMRLYVWGVGS